MQYVISFVFMCLIYSTNAHAKEKIMYGYLKGEIGGITIDEKIACHGQNEIPEAFIQEYPPLMGKPPPGRMKIGGSTDGKRLTLIVNGKGIDQKLMVRGVKHENGKYIYTGTKKYRSKPDVDVDIKFWCSPEIDHSQPVKKKTSKTQGKKVPYAIREFESIGHGVINTGSVPGDALEAALGADAPAWQRSMTVTLAGHLSCPSFQRSAGWPDSLRMPSI